MPPKIAKSESPRERKRRAPAGTADPAARLLALQHALAECDDPAAAFQQVVDAALEVMRSEGAALLLPASVPGTLQVRSVAGSPPAPLGDLVRVEDGALVPAAGAHAPDAAVVSIAPAVLTAPLTLCGVPCGVLAVRPGRAARKADREADLALLQELARAAAPAAAVGRAASLDLHLVEVGAIVEVGQVLTGLLDMEDVLSYVVYLAESLVSGHNTTVSLVTDDDHLVLRNSTGTLRASEGRRIPIDASLMGWVVRNGVAAISPSLAEDARGFAWEDRYGPALVVPLSSNGRIIGTFMVTRVEGAPPFSEADAVMLRTMASYATIAITNAEIHHQQQATADALRVQAAELQEAYGRLRESQDQLLISEKMAALGRVTAGIAHEINSPLGGVLNALRTARNYVEEYRSSVGDPEITPDDHRAIADDIQNALGVAEGAVTKVAQFVKSIKTQTRQGEGQTGSFDPAAEVDATVALLQHELRRRRVGVFYEMERGHRLVGDQGKFGVLMQNLISNAMDAFEDQPGEIWVRLGAEDGQLQVRVEDKGCGIPDAIRDRIFDYLFTTKGVGKGTGLGLSMVHSVVTSHFGGTIAMESAVGVGTTFTLTFPLTPATSDHGA